METAGPAQHAASRGEPGATTASDLRGVSRLVIDAVEGMTDIVESMHRNISGMAPLVGAPRQGRTRGVTGLVYRSVRGVTRMVGLGLDLALARLTPLLDTLTPSLRREAVRAALNGVLGDHLVASNNPLAIPMQLRKEGQAIPMDRQTLAEQLNPAAHVLVLVHGLCMNDLQWQRQAHDHGASLARDLGCSVLHLHYNTGLHISRNGLEFAELLEQLVQQWPVPVRALTLIGYSMGGLVSRSACHYAERAGHAWPRRLKQLLFLGTPHHGAPLERAGNWVDILGAISPYTAPLARLGKIRSAGVQDLRYGNIVDEDWENAGPRLAHDPRTPIPLPSQVQCFAIAATLQRKAGRNSARLRGDGLVPVSSALGQHQDGARSLAIPASHRSICYGQGHLDLLCSQDAYARILHYLGTG